MTVLEATKSKNSLDVTRSGRLFVLKLRGDRGVPGGIQHFVQQFTGPMPAWWENLGAHPWSHWDPFRLSSTRCSLFMGVFVTVLLVMRPVMAGENLESRFVKWREDSTLISGSAARALIQRQFIAFDPSYLEQRKLFAPKITAAAEKIRESEEAGRPLPCSTQIYLEAKWLFNYTANFEELEGMLESFADSLKTKDQSFANLQSAADGGWGPCYRRKFNRLDATVSGLEELQARKEGPQYAIRLYPEITSIEDFGRAMESLIVSDIPATGENRRSALNSVITSLGRTSLKRYWRPYIATSARADIYKSIPGGSATVEDQVRRFMDDWQDPETGFWGAWYRDGEKNFRTSDLSITFHVVSYRKGKVDHKVEIGEHLLASKNEEYPYGWFKDGKMCNHNNYDVVKILRLIWKDLPAALQDKFRVEIRKMTIWALRSSLRRDGSVEFYPAMFESVSAEYYYLISFLEQIGYWKADQRFWIGGDVTEVPYADDALSICSLIKRRFDSRRFQDGPSLATRQMLERACPDKL